MKNEDEKTTRGTHLTAFFTGKGQIEKLKVSSTRGNPKRI
eukprot:UN06045